ncbi:hypothetical protein AB0K12_17295 [Nonomuraea sp. NPDC049419]|uniref:hypothetical protein n=1 Tax=Nonomuraea sp. NPDC049419 TaxID=3155772 RepID=UPI003420A24F
MSSTAFDTAITQARDLLRWRSPLRTELWAARLTAGLEGPGQVEEFLRRAAEDGGMEARLALTALAAVNRPTDAPAWGDEGEGTTSPGDEAEGSVSSAAVSEGSVDSAGGAEGAPDVSGLFAVAGRGVADTLAGWVRRMGRVRCEGGWYGKADPYGEQLLAVLSFRYDNGKEPHILVVGIDQPSGGLAVDALVEEVKFLDELDLRPTPPESVAARMLDAFALTDRVMGAQVADTLPEVRPFAITRARTVLEGARLRATGSAAGPQHDVSGSGTGPTAETAHSTETAAPAETTGSAGVAGEPGPGPMPEGSGAREAFEVLMEFVGERTLWWSPARVSQFLTQWLPREAILSDAAIEAMPEVVRAWTMRQGGHSAVLRQIDLDAPRLPALMADESLASLNKRLALAAREG